MRGAIVLYLLLCCCRKTFFVVEKRKFKKLVDKNSKVGLLKNVGQRTSIRPSFSNSSSNKILLLAEPVKWATASFEVLFKLKFGEKDPSNIRLKGDLEIFITN